MILVQKHRRRRKEIDRESVLDDDNNNHINNGNCIHYVCTVHRRRRTMSNTSYVFTMALLCVMELAFVSSFHVVQNGIGLSSVPHLSRPESTDKTIPSPTITGSFHPAGISTKSMPRVPLELHSLLRSDTEEVVSGVIETTISTVEEEEELSSSSSSLSTPLKSNNNNLEDVDYSIILSLCFFVAALSALDRVAMSVAILPLSSELHLTETVKGQISSAFSAGYGLAIIPCGLLVSSASPRLTMAAGVSLWSLGTILTPYTASLIHTTTTTTDIEVIAETVTPLLLIRAVVGAAESIVLPTIQRFLSNWVPSSKRSVAVASIFAGFQTGTIAAYLLSPNVMEMLGGWRQLFYLYGSVGILWLGPWLLLAKDSPQTDDDATATKQLQECKLTNTGMEGDAGLLLECEPALINNTAIYPNPATSRDTDSTTPSTSIGTTITTIQKEALNILKAAPWKDFRKSPGVLAIMAAHAASNWGLYNNLAWTPTFYAEQYGLNVRDSAFLSLTPSVAGAIGGLFAGNMADFVIKRQWFNAAKNTNSTTNYDTTNIRKIFQAVALLGPTLCLSLLSSHIPESPSTAQLLLTCTVGLQAFNAAGYGPATQEKAGERWTGLLYSITSLPGVLIGTGGVYLTGQILDATQNDWGLVFGLNAAINVLGALAFLSLYDSKREFE